MNIKLFQRIITRTQSSYIRTKINRFFSMLNDTCEFDVRNNARVFLTSETFRKRWGLDDYRQFLRGIQANVCLLPTNGREDIFLLLIEVFFFFFESIPIFIAIRLLWFRIHHVRKFSHLVRISRYALKRCSLEIEIGLSRRYLN